MPAEGLKSAADMVKQVITLSTGIIALTITFLEKIVQPSAEGLVWRHVPWALIIAWGCYLIAVLLGLMTLGAITGSLNALDRKERGMQLDDPQGRAAEMLAGGSNVVIPARLMSLAFVLALVFTVVAVFVT